MKKWQITGLVIVIVLLAGIVIAEQMTFSTYYPAPYGRYREFSTTGLTILATDEFGSEGDNARVGIGTTNPETSLTIYGPTQNDIGTESQSMLLVGNPDPRYNALFIGASPMSFPKTDGTAVEWSVNGSYRAHPMIYRSMRYPNNGTGEFPFNQYGELILQGASYKTGYNKGISFVTWDGVGANDPAIRMRIKENGNVGIGTVSPNSSKGSGGYLDAKDVYLRDTGTWASEAGGKFDQGYVAQGGYTTSVSFAVSFSGINSVSITGQKPQGVAMRATVSTPTTSGFTIYDPDQQVNGYYWQAWGY